MSMNEEALARGTATQLALRAARLQGGDAHLGWKIGFGSAASMQKLGIQAPLLGFLSRKAVLPSGASLNLAAFTQAVAEPEIAVHLGASLGAGASEAAVRAAIAGLGPAIEIADVSFPPTDPERILAANVYQRGIILGPMDPGRAGAGLAGLSAHLLKDGSEIEQTTDVEANTGRIVDLIRGVADRLAELGMQLRAGDVVIVGSMVPPHFVQHPCLIDFRLDPYDTLSVRFTGGT
jgi:2-keto-4-pentenoate hydratase